MKSSVYWFRNCVRLSDNPSLVEAIKNSEYLLPLYIHQPDLDQLTTWGFPRTTNLRKKFLAESLEDLRSKLKDMGSNLVELNGQAEDVFQTLRDQHDLNTIYCEQIEAPEESQQVLALKKRGFNVIQLWQSSMIDIKDLPYDVKTVPDVFTQFRKHVERKGLFFTKPVEAPKSMPPLPVGVEVEALPQNPSIEVIDCQFKGGETAFSAHLTQYLERRLPDTYKATRNQLLGKDFSSKFSPWLAVGCCSVRVIMDKLKEYESQYGANESTYWLWFELLWRDYFRFIHFKYGVKLYWSKGLSTTPLPAFDARKFALWSSGTTGEELVDAGMRELNATGYLSNRMRQIVASYWIYDMHGDWRAGAAWFESQLIDYDVYSNQGNWLYIAGRGTDPRGGRSFNVKKQTREHDSDGAYRRRWLGTATGH
jgi:deoxyribodipyrimidine photo-lyase